MLVKAIRDEDYSSYKEVSMLIAFPTCNFKCCTELKRSVAMCQNSPVAKQPSFDVSAEEIYNRYSQNVITHSIVCAGLEPFDSYDDLCELLFEFRYKHDCQDVFVIYTGYTENEVELKIRELASNFSNIIVKYGRYIPTQSSHTDKLLGVTLASPYQYAKQIS